MTLFSKDFNLRDICHVCTNDEGDRFVGIKADANNVEVKFPLGFDLSNGVCELRRDITILISVLQKFTEKKDKLLVMNSSSNLQSVDFPINAYMNIISDYMTRSSYYIETKIKYITSDLGKVDWRKTIRKHRPFVQSNGSPAYTKFEVRKIDTSDQTLMTRIHEFCVYDAFQKIGWLFPLTEMPRQPQIKLEGKKNIFIGIVRDKMGETFLDKDKQLFQSMINILSYFDEQSPQKSYYFGTDRFEYVWEKMIDSAFGIKEKSKFFPRTYWRLHSNSPPFYKNSALEPDTIMILKIEGKNVAFVLDAKYYRYGVTGNPSHLPPSSSINKQITYGEYVNTLKTNGINIVFNAFIMPFNKKKNPFYLKCDFEYIGEAYGDWKQTSLSHEVVKGIIVDTKYLMYNHSSIPNNQRDVMARAIIQAYKLSQTF